MITALILLNIAHFLGDYTHLSTTWMLKAKRFGAPLFPIFVHALIHACLFAVIAWFLATDPHTVAVVFLFQLITHFIIDVLKGKVNVWFPSVAVPTNKQHWYVFGLDQTLHQIVIILIANII